MPKFRLMRLFFLALFVSVANSCVSDDGWFYPYGYDYDFDWDWDDYFWRPTPFGGWTVVNRPVYVVDGWTNTALRGRPYRYYTVSRHNSPVIVYNAKKGDRNVEINLTPMGDSTRVEVRTRRGKNKWEPQSAQRVASSIFRESK